MNTANQPSLSDYYYLPRDSARPSALFSAISLHALLPVEKAIKSFNLLLNRQTSPTRKQINRALKAIHNALGKAHDSIKDSESVEATATLKDTGEEKYDIYDRYFAVRRVANITPALFLCNGLRILFDSLDDILESHLHAREVGAIINGIGTMLHLTMDRGASVEKAYKPLTNLPTRQAGQAYTEEPGKEKAMRRWIVHHLQFDLVLIYSIHELDSATEAVANGQFEEAACYLDHATILFQASTACMWAASAFNSKVYLEHIRPSMVSTNTPNGFSGDMNMEFMNWQIRQQALHQVLNSLQVIPKPLLLAANRFVDAYWEDGEEHIKLAAAAVGDKASLSQCVTEEKYGVTYKHGAVGALKGILEARKNDWEFIKTKTTL